MFRNLTPVTKNILLLNITIYIAGLVLSSKAINLGDLLGAHYINSALFEPYQVVTHMFMHDLSSPFHIFFNMFLLVMFGSHLERIWGAKRFFFFYIACGFGAFALFNSIGAWQISSLKNEIISQDVNIESLNEQIRMFFSGQQSKIYNLTPEMRKYAELSLTPMFGASGALFGLLAGFAMLFPNTQLMLLFPPIPIKAKYLIGGYIIFEVVNSISQQNSQIAHLAHVGGAIVGIIIILIWRRRDRKNFY
jgi:membrane associated rhomboid family serine protease